MRKAKGREADSSLRLLGPCLLLTAFHLSYRFAAVQLTEVIEPHEAIERRNKQERSCLAVASSSNRKAVGPASPQAPCLLSLWLSCCTPFSQTLDQNPKS